MRPQSRRVVMWLSLASAYAFWSIFFGVVCGTTPQTCSGAYFDPVNRGFVIFGETRNSTSELVIYSFAFAAGSYVSILLLFFVWPVIGTVVYSTSEGSVNEVMKKYGLGRVEFTVALIAYSLVVGFFVFLGATGAVSNIVFVLCTALGTFLGYVTGCAAQTGESTKATKRRSEVRP